MHAYHIFEKCVMNAFFAFFSIFFRALPTAKNLLKVAIRRLCLVEAGPNLSKNENHRACMPSATSLANMRSTAKSRNSWCTPHKRPHWGGNFAETKQAQIFRGAPNYRTPSQNSQRCWYETDTFMNLNGKKKIHHWHQHSTWLGHWSDDCFAQSNSQSPPWLTHHW